MFLNRKLYSKYYVVLVLADANAVAGTEYSYARAWSPVMIWAMPK